MESFLLVILKALRRFLTCRRSRVITSFTYRIRIVRIQIDQRQPQKLLLVLPRHLACRETLRICGRRRRVRDLGDEVRGGRFSDAVDQHAQQGDLQEDVEAHSEAEEHALPIVEPVFLLFPGEAHAREVGFELFAERESVSTR